MHTSHLALDHEDQSARRDVGHGLDPCVSGVMVGEQYVFPFENKLTLDNKLSIAPSLHAEANCNQLDNTTRKDLTASSLPLPLLLFLAPRSFGF